MTLAFGLVFSSCNNNGNDITYSAGGFKVRATDDDGRVHLTTLFGSDIIPPHIQGINNTLYYLPGNMTELQTKVNIVRRWDGQARTKLSFSEVKNALENASWFNPEWGTHLEFKDAFSGDAIGILNELQTKNYVVVTYKMNENMVFLFYAFIE